MTSNHHVGAQARDTARSGFATYGMFIIDRIVESDGRVLEDVIGGAGTFAAIGARMFSRHHHHHHDDNDKTPSLSTVEDSGSFIVDYGSDTPPEIVERLRSYGLDLVERYNPDRLCTRGLNTYDAELGVRRFEYTTPKVRITPSDMPRRLQRARAVHCVCSPGRLIAILDELDGLSSAEDIADRTVVWEPIPDSCFRPADQAPGEGEPDPWLDEYRAASRRCAVISPNAHELAGLTDSAAIDDDDPDWPDHLTGLATKLVQRLSLDEGRGSLVVRCGARGCCVRENGRYKWLPAYLDSAAEVIDPTGAGNTFCGALARILTLETPTDDGTLYRACRGATVAAGLACMQVGLPLLTRSDDGVDLWNGRSIASRLEDLDARLDAIPQDRDLART